MKLWIIIIAAVLLAAVIGTSFFAINKAIEKSTNELNMNFDDLKLRINSRVYKIELDGNKFKKVKSLNITLQPNVTDYASGDTLSDLLWLDRDLDTVYVVIR